MLRSPQPQVVALDEPAAGDPELTGGKAAALAHLDASGLTVLEGVVLTTEFTAACDDGLVLEGADAVRKAFDRIDGERRSLIVRSSSVGEDTITSSMAGQFASVLGVDGFDAFVAAVRAVLDSRAAGGHDHPSMAVLVQPMIEPALGGVLFGVDPVSGRSDLRLINAVAGGPAPLVSGERKGSHYVVTDGGRTRESDTADGAVVSRRDRRRLLALAERTADIFGHPQDVEWAIAGDGTLLVLQSRPVTTEVRGVPSGPVYGPGPVAETFPEALTRLEADLWVPPLRSGVRHALRLAGITRSGASDQPDVVVCLEGRVAIDLQCTGAEPASASWWSRSNPLPRLRRLRAAWRVGRLRAALPRLAENLLRRADADLATVPALTTLSDQQLLAVLRRGRQVLSSLHAHEILFGMLTETDDGAVTGAAVALAVLADARRDGLDDEAIVAASPVVLALSAPRVAARAELPATADWPVTTPRGPRPETAMAAGVTDGVRRESLRLRIRWVHELMARAAWELGERLTAAGVIASPVSVAKLGLDDLGRTLRGHAVPASTAEDRDGDPIAPLPARFRISDLGRPIPVVDGANRGRGASPGVAAGPVTHDAVDPARGSVLVVRTLAPELGPVLPRLAGVVSETGSVLSHLAILAREFGVPAVVSYPDATTAFAVGTTVRVDGVNGTVDATHSTGVGS